MKRLLLVVFLLGFAIFAHADTIVITVTPEEIKAVEAIVMDAQDWLQKAWDGKVNKCIDRVIIEVTDKNPAKLTEQEKKDIIKNAVVKSRKEKKAERELKDKGVLK